MELWQPKLRIERAYRRSLGNIAKAIIERIGDDADINTIRQTLRRLMRSSAFQDFAEQTAMRMVTHLFVDQGRTWREAAKNSARGSQIYQAIMQELRGNTGRILQRQIERNASLIRTLPQSIADDITRFVAAEALKGKRSQALVAEILKKFPAQTKARADLIARTEVSKTHAGLLEARCRNIGVNWYIWCAVGGSRGDGRTRSSHRGMSGVLVSWDDPPAPEDLFAIIGKTGKRYKNTLGRYHAGCCPNCRCFASPIIDLDNVEWPARVHRHGSITKMRRKEFERKMQ